MAQYYDTCCDFALCFKIGFSREANTLYYSNWLQASVQQLLLCTQEYLDFRTVVFLTSLCFFYNSSHYSLVVLFQKLLITVREEL